MSPDAFHYTPCCQNPDCTAAAVFKIAAVWSDGTFRELKTYALACEAHRDELLAAARDRRAALRLGPGEHVDEVAAFKLGPATPHAQASPQSS